MPYTLISAHDGQLVGVVALAFARAGSAVVKHDSLAALADALARRGR